jgi:hypothetical protein
MDVFCDYCYLGLHQVRLKHGGYASWPDSELHVHAYLLASALLCQAHEEQHPRHPQYMHQLLPVLPLWTPLDQLCVLDAANRVPVAMDLCFQILQV